MPNVSFGGPTDYQAEQEKIKQQQMLAQMLIMQSMKGQSDPGSVGGIPVKQSRMAPFAQMAQALAGTLGNQAASRSQADLAQRQKSEQMDTLAKIMQAMQGSPGGLKEGPSEAPDQMGPGMPVQTPGTPPDMNRAAMLGMGSNNPAFQSMGMQLMQKAQQQQAMQRFMSQFGGGQPSGGAPAGAPGMGGPQAGPQAGGFPGVSPAALAAMGSGDPMLGDLGKMIQGGYKDMNMPTRFNEGGGLANGMGQVLLSSPKAGMQMRYDQNGVATAVPVPNAIPIEAGRAGQIAGAQAGAKAEFTPQSVTMPDQSTEIFSQGQLLRGAPQGGAWPKAYPTQQSMQMPGQGGIVRGEELTDEAALRRAQDLAASGKQFSIQGPQPQQGRFGQSQGEKIKQDLRTAAGKETDQVFAKDYVAWSTGQGADAAKQIAQLEDVSKALKSGDNLTGPVIGRVPDAIKSFTNPKSIAMRERVEEVTQRSLRAILGAQFTEKEGERLIARAYNPNQPEAENLIRVNRMISQLGQAFKAKQDAAAYFQKNGTLEGWGGKLYSISDFDPSNAGASAAAATSIDDLVKKYAR